MKKIIGIVGEGPVDQMVLKAAINKITGEKHIYRNIQPEQDMTGQFGNGWKGVYRWCEMNAELIPALFSAISPALDLLIIQMDGDVARKEKEVHCRCKSAVCPEKQMESPLMCRRVKSGNCPVELPCGDHDSSPDGYRKHLEKLLRSLLGKSAGEEKIVIVIPCDSTDTWTAAAYEENIEDIESVTDPWERIISLKKEYHGIRIPGHKKNTAIYRLFVPQIVRNWDNITRQCQAAGKLETDVRQWMSKMEGSGHK